MHIKSKWVEKTIPCQQESKESRSHYTIADSADFKARKVIRDKEGLYTMIKESVF